MVASFSELKAAVNVKSPLFSTTTVPSASISSRLASSTPIVRVPVASSSVMVISLVPAIVTAVSLLACASRPVPPIVRAVSPRSTVKVSTSSRIRPTVSLSRSRVRAVSFEASFASIVNALLVREFVTLIVLPLATFNSAAPPLVKSASIVTPPLKTPYPVKSAVLPASNMRVVVPAVLLSVRLPAVNEAVEPCNVTSCEPVTV